VSLRQEALAEALKLKKLQAPHATTYSRVLNEAVEIEQFEQVVAQFFKGQPRAGRSVQIAIDGKTLRARFQPAGRTACICWPPTCPKKAGCCSRSTPFGRAASGDADRAAH